jgi:hypothetical protein
LMDNSIGAKSTIEKKMWYSVTDEAWIAETPSGVLHTYPCGVGNRDTHYEKII